MSSTSNSIAINATPESVFDAFSNSTLLEQWLVPDEMKGKIHDFNFAVGKGYTMSLFYPDIDKDSRGKSAETEDRYTATILEVIPNHKILQQINFHSDDPALKNGMQMEVLIDREHAGSKVTINFTNLPTSISPEANSEGTDSSLKKLKALVEQSRLPSAK